MNRRDAALIAHLDAIEGRVTALIISQIAEVRADIRQLREDVAGIKLDLATHGHDED